MTTLFDTALAGMSRNLSGVETAARNIANVNTDGYHAQRDESAGSAASSSASVSPADEAAMLDLPTSNVDLATELVDLKMHEIGYQANGLLIKVADRLTQDILDLLA